MSDTPRTDSVINATRNERGVYDELDRMTDLARELERENANLRAQLSEANRLNESRLIDSQNLRLAMVTRPITSNPASGAGSHTT